MGSWWLLDMGGLRMRMRTRYLHTFRGVADNSSLQT